MPKTKKTTKKIDSQKLDEEIRERAYEISQGRNTQEGDSQSDWLQAEKEIKKKYKIK
jgi:hypothetical protein